MNLSQTTFEWARLSSIAFACSLLCYCKAGMDVSVRTGESAAACAHATAGCPSPSPNPLGSFSSTTVKATQKDAVGQTAVITWSAPDGAATAVTYSIYKSTDGTLTTVDDLKTKAASVASGLTSTSYSVSSLTAGQTTYFYVLASDAKGNQLVSSPIAFTGAKVPPSPGGSGQMTAPGAGISGSSINVLWQLATAFDGTSNGVTYDVYQSLSNNLDSLAHVLANGTRLTTPSLAAGTTQYTATGLAAATSYYFVVVAKDASGNQSVYSSVNASTSSDVTLPVAGNAGTITKTGVTSTGFTANWTAGTDNTSAPAALQYKVFYSTSNNIATVATAQSNGTSANSWTAASTSFALTGLTPSTTYYVNVLVKDEAGNIGTYASSTQATAADSTAPVPGNSGSFTVNSVNSGGFTVNWTTATDDVTAATSLQYRVYYSTSNNIGTAANAQSNGTAANGWTTNIATYAVTGLSPSTTYYVNVVVKDAAGNVGGYTSQSQVTSADTTPPTPGNSGTITTASLTSTSVVLNWTAATDNGTAQASLQYIVYQSSSNNISTPANAAANGSVLQTWANNYVSFTVNSLTASTSYYFNVLVKDGAGNIGAYTTLNVTTSSSGGGGGNTATRYIFATTTTINGYQMGNGGGSTATPTYGADSACSGAAGGGSATIPLMTTNWSWNALVGVNGNTLRSRAALATNVTIKNMSGQTVTTTEAYLFATGTLASIHMDQNGSSNFNNSWTGGDASVTACNNWSSNSSGVTGSVGDGLANDYYWYDTGGTPMTTCDTAESVLCINTPPAYIFATSTTYNGNLGGVTGADNICATRAAAGSLTSNLGVTRWRAIVGGASTARLRISFPYNIRTFLPDGTTLVATKESQIFNDSGGALAHGVDMDENGAAASGNAWSDTNSSNCTGWTDSSSGTVGAVGSVGATNSTWRVVSPFTCNLFERIYCIGM